MNRCYWDPGTGRIKAIKDTPDPALDRSWNYIDLPSSVADIAREQNEIRRSTAAFVKYDPVDGTINEVTFDPSSVDSPNIASCPRPLAERIVAGLEDSGSWVCGYDGSIRILKPAVGALRTIYTETKNFIGIRHQEEYSKDAVSIIISVDKDGVWEAKLISRWPVGAIELPSGELKFAITAIDDPALLLAVFSIPYSELLSQQKIKGKIENQKLQKGDVILFASVGAGMNINAFVYQM